MGRDKGPIDRLLSAYLLCGLAATVSFWVFVVLLTVVANGEGPLNLPLLFADLLWGFLWIGTTSIGRHVFILLKQYIGEKVTALEFLSTQFVAVVLPFAYMRIKEETDTFRRRNDADILHPTNGS